MAVPAARTVKCINLSIVLYLSCSYIVYTNDYKYNNYDLNN